MTQPLTWFDLSRLKDGTRVVFAEDWDIFPICMVPKGTTGSVVENGLNEIWCLLLVAVDDDKIREDLREWDGRVTLSNNNLDPGAKLHEHPEACTAEENDKANEWYAPSPLALAEAA
jgi:hypothetical protein